MLVSVIISAVMVLGSMAWVNEHKPAPLGANTLISALTTGTTLDDADHIIYNDNSGTPTTKKITWANATSSLQTYYNGVYQTLLVNSAGLRGALSDETGSGVAVFGTGPTISGANLTTSASITAPTFDVAGTDATGDTYYNGGSGLFTRLPIGSSGQFLMASTTGVPEWNNSQILTNPMNTASTFNATTTVTAPTIGMNHFGGTGADGALSISSGVTVIDLGASSEVVKNYTSISITGTGALAFTNPATTGTTIVLKSQGNCTLTSSAAPMIDASGMGAASGTPVTANNTNTNGVSGTAASTALWSIPAGAGSTAKGAGQTNTATAISLGFQSVATTTVKYLYVGPGSGGGSGGAEDVGASGTATSGSGGRGGGAIVMECAGAWNFTTTSGISVAGKNATNGSYAGTRGDAIGGAGGGGGFFLGLYNYLVANSGTITVSGGSAGTNVCTPGAGINGYNGAVGGASAKTAATNGSTGGVDSCGSSSAGATGYSATIQNSVFN